VVCRLYKLNGDSFRRHACYDRLRVVWFQYSGSGANMPSRPVRAMSTKKLRLEFNRTYPATVRLACACSRPKNNQSTSICNLQNWCSRTWSTHAWQHNSITTKTNNMQRSSRLACEHHWPWSMERTKKILVEYIWCHMKKSTGLAHFRSTRNIKIYRIIVKI
jgi:hypothetical protein